MADTYTETQHEMVEFICVFSIDNLNSSNVKSIDSTLKENNHDMLYQHFKDIFSTESNRNFGLKTINTKSIIDNYIHITFKQGSDTIGIIIKTFPINVFVKDNNGPLYSNKTPENAQLIENPQHTYSNVFQPSY